MTLKDKALAILHGHVEQYTQAIHSWPDFLDVHLDITLDDAIEALQYHISQNNYEGVPHWAFTIMFMSHTFSYPTTSVFYTSDELFFINRTLCNMLHNFTDLDLEDQPNLEAYINESFLVLKTMAQAFKEHKGFIALHYNLDLAYLLSNLIELGYVPLTTENVLVAVNALSQFQSSLEVGIHFATLEAMLNTPVADSDHMIESTLLKGTCLPHSDAYYRLAKYYQIYRKDNAKYLDYLNRGALLGDAYAILALADEYINKDIMDKELAFYLLLNKYRSLKSYLFDQNDDNIQRAILTTPLDLYCLKLGTFLSNAQEPFFYNKDDALSYAAMAYYISYTRFQITQTAYDEDTLNKTRSLVQTILASHLKYIHRKSEFDNLVDYFEELNQYSNLLNIVYIHEDKTLTLTFYTPVNFIIEIPKDGYFDFTNTVSIELTEPLIVTGRDKSQIAFSTLEYNATLHTITFKDMSGYNLFSCQGKTIKLIKNKNWEDIKK